MDGALFATADTSVVVGLFLGIALVELLRPARVMSRSPGRRWVGNLLLYATTSMLMLPVIAAFPAAESTRGGVLTWIAPPAPLRLLASVALLDLLNYGLHRIYHNVGVLWRLHAVHHSDPELDITTTLRHHPLEMLLNAAVFAGFAMAMGITPGEVLLYGWLAWAVQFPAHANIALPRRITAALRGVLVTPAFHQVHHSRRPTEIDTNYGEVFAFWDSLFRSERQPADSHGEREFGLDNFRDDRSQSLPRLLAQPVLRGVVQQQPVTAAER